MTSTRREVSVDEYRALAVRHGLKFYASTGMKPNRAWTPKNMMRVASEYTGNKYKRGEYLKAADDIGRKLGVIA